MWKSLERHHWAPVYCQGSRQAASISALQLQLLLYIYTFLHLDVVLQYPLTHVGVVITDQLP